MTDEPSNDALVRYADIPQTMRDLLDEVYTPRGVEIWWNSPNTMLHGHRARDLWRVIGGRRDVVRVVEYLTGGGW